MPRGGRGGKRRMVRFGAPGFASQRVATFTRRPAPC